MRYSYRGVRVESGLELDSTLFHKTKPEEKETQPTSRRPAARKTQTRKTQRK